MTDLEILREGLKLARRLGEASPLASSMTGETAPGSSVQTDQEWETWLAGQVSTEFHPSSTCAMLPLDQGGVVDANLRVYGLSNVRVADASVPPIVFSAHLMSSTYGLAEQASSMIRAFYNALPPKPHTAHNGTDSNGSGVTSGPAHATATAGASNGSSLPISSNAKHHSLTAGAEAGIVIGVIVLLAAAGAAVAFFIVLPRRHRAMPISKSLPDDPSQDDLAAAMPPLEGDTLLSDFSGGMASAPAAATAKAKDVTTSVREVDHQHE